MFKYGILLAAVCLPALAQDDWCSVHGYQSNDLVTHAEVREEHLAALPEIVVNPEKNGSIKVHGWGNSDIQIKACVRAAAETDSAAAALGKQVTITDGPGRVVAKGPQGKASWSVSYEIWAPSSASYKMETLNGSVSVETVTGHIQVQTSNGSVRLKDVDNDVDAATTNGSVSVDLASSGWRGTGGIDLKTTNGSIHLNVPESFSAQVEASTVNGSVKTDFPVQLNSENKHNISFTVGGGGPKVEAKTVNGSVHVARIS